MRKEFVVVQLSAADTGVTQITSSNQGVSISVVGVNLHGDRVVTSAWEKLNPAMLELNVSHNQHVNTGQVIAIYHDEELSALDEAVNVLDPVDLEVVSTIIGVPKDFDRQHENERASGGLGIIAAYDGPLKHVQLEGNKLMMWLGYVLTLVVSAVLSLPIVMLLTASHVDLIGVLLGAIVVFCVSFTLITVYWFS